MNRLLLTLSLMLAVPAFATTFNSRSAEFDGSQKATLPASTPSLKGDKPVTIVVSVKIPDPAGWGGIVQKATSGDNGFELVANTRFLRIYLQNGSTTLDKQMDNAELSEAWNTVAMTYDPSGEVHMYVNGSEVGIHNSYPVTLTTPYDNSALPVEVGAGFKGKMSQLQIYQRVLTPTEIAALSSGATPTDPQTLATSDDLISHLPLGDKPDNKHTMHDDAGQSTGTVSGDISFSTDHP